MIGLEDYTTPKTSRSNKNMPSIKSSPHKGYIVVKIVLGVESISVVILKFVEHYPQR